MLTKQKAISWMMTFADQVIENKQLLSDLDSAIGDGDHGINMSRGLIELKKVFVSTEPVTLQDVFKTSAMTVLSKVGGASGPLYGSAFMAMAKAVPNEDLSRDEITVMLKAGLAGIQHRGKAEVGEKTMVDVWQPVMQALSDEKLSIDAIDAALEGTKELKATKGRAAYLGDRSIGHLDPGAYSSSLLFKSLLQVGGLDE